MRMVTIPNKGQKEKIKEVFKEAHETHYVRIYHAVGYQSFGFMDKHEAVQRSKALIPLINSTRNASSNTKSKET